jgi:hypothetical protein
LESPAEEEAVQPATIVLRHGWGDALAGDGFDRIVGGMAPYLRSQRWYGAKGDRIADVRAVDTIPVDRGAVGLVEVHPQDGDAQTYVVPMVTRPAAADPVPPPYAVIAQLLVADEQRVVVDGLWDERFASALLDIVERRRTVRGSTGRLIGSRTEAYAELRGDASIPLEPRVSGAEQSNTSIAFGDRMIMKVFRRPGSGRKRSGSESHVRRPITTGWPIVSDRKRSRSSGMRHGMPPPRPITPPRATAATSETLTLPRSQTATGARIAGWCMYPTTSKSSNT